MSLVVRMRRQAAPGPGGAEAKSYAHRGHSRLPAWAAAHDEAAADAMKPAVRAQRAPEGRGGSPLPPSVRSRFEPRLGLDLGGVRVHADAAAARSASSMGALAYAAGGDVFFGPGQYAPGTSTGDELLGHELAHVAQAADRGERSGDADLPVRPKLVVKDADKTVPWLPAPDNATARGSLVVGWLTQLCGAGKFSVDLKSGDVTMTNRDEVCKDDAKGSTHPVSCKCMCRATDPATPQVDVVLTEKYTADYFQYDPSSKIYDLKTDVNDLSKTGEGTSHSLRNQGWVEHDTVALSGRSAKGIKGVGDTSAPSAGTLRDPPWIILGHEICGHLFTTKEGDRRGHEQSRAGDFTTFDVENQIRREHSTGTASYGIRTGEGVDYILKAGDSLNSLSNRFGWPTGKAAFQGGIHCCLEAMGDPLDDSPSTLRDVFKAGQVVFLKGVHFHHVVAGETLDSIAKIWGVTVAVLKRANPGVAQAKAGDALLVPKP